jgi:tRNA A37 methylthiotransferase MiaB
MLWDICAGEVLLGDLARAGFQITEEHEDADAIVVNTCAFVEDAKAESLEVRQEWRGATSLNSNLYRCVIEMSCSSAAQRILVVRGRRACSSSQLSKWSAHAAAQLQC